MDIRVMKSAQDCTLRNEENNETLIQRDQLFSFEPLISRVPINASDIRQTRPKVAKKLRWVMRPYFKRSPPNTFRCTGRNDRGHVTVQVDETLITTIRLVTFKVSRREKNNMYYGILEI